MRKQFSSAALGILAASALSSQTPVFVDNGVLSGDRLGHSVASAGDVDADGHDDIIYSAPKFDAPSRVDAGLVRVRSGKTGLVLHELVGTSRGIEFGTSVDGAGDVNGDGHDDFVVSSVGTNSYRGTVQVFSGANGSVLHTFQGEAANDVFGWSVSGAGDLNADGYDDIVVGAPRNDSNGVDSGEVTAYSGRTGAILWQRQGEAAGDQFGWSVAGIGDANGNLHCDVIVGAPYSDIPIVHEGHLFTDAGHAYVIAGRSGNLLFDIIGTGENNRFGWSVAGAGDLNGDGRGDFIVGADRATHPTGGNRAGLARAFSGATGETLFTWLGQTSNQGVGGAVGAAGDIDNDGRDDVIVAAPFGDSTNGNDTGFIHVYSGRDGRAIVALSLIGSATNDAFGFAVACTDMNKDGFPEIIVSAPAKGGVGEMTVYSAPTSGVAPRTELRGTACPTNTGTLPRISHVGRPGVGDNYSPRLRGALPNKPVVLVMGTFWNQPVPNAPGCTAYPFPLFSLNANSNFAGVASVSINVPSNPALIGASVHHQWMQVDALANGLGLIGSNDLAVWIGD